MGNTLFEATYRVARELGQVTEGVATGGSTTTIVDTNDRTEADDYWNGGTAWIIYDAGGAAAAPEGSFSVISDFSATNDTITLRTTLSAIAASDKYAISKKRYSLYKLIEQVNAALIAMGPIATTDTTSVDTAVNETEYTLPIAANFDLREVYLQGRTNDSDDNRWIKIHNWKIIKTAGGTADELVLPQFVSGRDVMLVYAAPHAVLRSAADKIDESVHLDRVVFEAALGCLMWRYQKVGTQDPKLENQIAVMRQKAERARMEHPIRIPRRTGRIFRVGAALSAKDQFDWPDPA